MGRPGGPEMTYVIWDLWQTIDIFRLTIPLVNH